MLCHGSHALPRKAWKSLVAGMAVVANKGYLRLKRGIAGSGEALV
jgi:hypothetical protein